MTTWGKLSATAIKSLSLYNLIFFLTMKVIQGPPNSGKSTLLNLLSKRDVAIVSDIPGTTRDVLTISLNLAGYQVNLFDTAGLRESSDAIEKEGMKRSL